MAQLFKSREHWLSAYALCRAGAMRIDGGVVRIGDRSQRADADAVTIAVIMNEHNYYNTLSSLANIDYPDYRVLFVSRTTADYDKYAGHVASYGHVIPQAGIFRPEADLSLGDAILAALQNVKTPYVCLVFNGDMLHPSAIAKAVAALKRTGKSYCTDIGFIMNEDGWATPADIVRGDTQLMFFKMSEAVRHLADDPTIEHPRALLWHLIYNFSAQAVQLPELLYFHGVLNFTKYYKDNAAYRDSPYSQEVR